MITSRLFLDVEGYVCGIKMIVMYDFDLCFGSVSFDVVYLLFFMY